MGHRVPRHHGEAEARLSGGRGAPWSSGHGEACSTETLPATRKKSAQSSFPAKSSNKSGSVECARSRHKTIERYAATAQALVRRWELTGDEQGDGKTEEEETTKTTAAQVIKDGQEAQGSHGGAISLTSTTPRWPRARLEASRRIAGNVA